MKTIQFTLLTGFLLLCLQSTNSQEVTDIQKTPKSTQETVFGQTHLFQISFFDEDKGVIVGGATTNAFITPDGGDYWSAVSAFPNTMIRGLKLLEETGNGIAVGQWRTIFKTENYGSSWTQMGESEGTTHFMSVDIKNGVGLAVSEDGKVYRTAGLFTSASVNSTELSNKIRFQNPIKDELFIDTDIDIQSLAIYDLSGKIFLKNESSKKINISHLSKGIYLLQINTLEGNVMSKIIKE